MIAPIRPTLALLLLAALACDAPTEPTPRAGVYVLETLSGHSLPLLTVENAVARQRLLADTVWLLDAERGVRAQWSAIESLSGANFGPSPYRVEWGIRFERRGREVRAVEEIGCLQEAVTEECSSLWDQPVSVDRDRLSIGVRRYRRARD